jgi:hypothetical protein
MEPHPDREEEPEARADGRGGLIAAVVIGGIFLIIIVVHLTVGLTLHSR